MYAVNIELTEKSGYNGNSNQHALYGKLKENLMLHRDNFCGLVLRLNVITVQELYHYFMKSRLSTCSRIMLFHQRSKSMLLDKLKQSNFQFNSKIIIVKYETIA